MEQAMTNINLDRSDWELVTFGEVAIKQKESVDRENTDLTRYIKGEHMGSEDLHIRKWGELTDEYLGPAFIRKFEKGDILYGSRRTYLRKVAIADFDGITSNTTFVIKANQKNILPELLPFVMMSEGFTEHSIKNSKGSVNPYVNWKDIANYEFLLPPKNQQAQLAELLWAMDSVIENEFRALEKLEKTYNALIDNTFSIINADWTYIPLNKIAVINKKSLKSNTDPNYEFKYLDIASIVEPKQLGEMDKITFSTAPSRARRVLADNSIILSLVRPYHQSFVFVSDATDIIASTGTGVIEVKPEHNKKFVFHQFFSRKFIQFCENKMTGTNYPAITSRDLEQFKIAIPTTRDIQDKVANNLEALDDSMKNLKSQITRSKSLQKTLNNQVF
jgi:type I restriction enzyme S subunit